MPKATRANDNQETPKKRSRKTQPVNGNGTTAVEPVTTAPAIAQTTPEAKAPQTTAVPVNGNKPTNGAKSISEELVRHRAYELYLQRRGQGGSPEQDWFQALQEISGQHVA
jgi:hypothetical protein